ncbi:MAG: sugar phosphate isomerase/epimerase, partial [Bacteroidota bacterium]
PGTPVVTRIADVPPNAFEELPDGEMPIKDLMRYGKELGVTYCMVEQDGNYDVNSLESVRESFDFLRG